MARKYKYETTFQKSLVQKEGQKSCQKCRLQKPIDQFSVNKKGVLKNICNNCVEYLKILNKWDNKY